MFKEVFSQYLDLSFNLKKQKKQAITASFSFVQTKYTSLMRPRIF